MTPYYDDGQMTIYHGDCRAVLPSLSRDGVAVCTDPPYGIAYATNYTVRGVGAPWLGTQIDGDGSTALRDWVVTWANGLPMIVFGSWKVPKPPGTRGVLIWDKGPERGMGDLSFPWKPSFEEIYILGNGFSGHRDEAVLKGFHLPSWVSHGRCHPNEKPVGLLRYLLTKTVAPTVIDPFMGSGSTLRAAMDLGRRAIGIEIEEQYCEMAARRLAQMVLL